MITQREAKRQILAQWDEWPAKTGSKSEGDKHAFYTWLQGHHPELLDFPGLRFLALKPSPEDDGR